MKKHDGKRGEVVGEKGVMRVAGRKEGTFKRKCRV